MKRPVHILQMVITAQVLESRSLEKPRPKVSAPKPKQQQMAPSLMPGPQLVLSQKALGQALHLSTRSAFLRQIDSSNRLIMAPVVDQTWCECFPTTCTSLDREQHLVTWMIACHFRNH